MTESHLVRRLETLSDTVFGLAVTFMASRLPTPDRSGPAPDWLALFDTLSPHLEALLLSFCVAVIFWLSHHRRIAASPRLGPVAILLNFTLLLCVILLPTTSDLFGMFGRDGDAVELYAGHLALISSLNFALWVIAARGTAAVWDSSASWRSTVGPGLVSAIFLVSAVTAHWHSDWAEYMMLTAFLGPFVSVATRRRAGGTVPTPLEVSGDRSARRDVLPGPA